MGTKDKHTSVIAAGGGEVRLSHGRIPYPRRKAPLKLIGLIAGSAVLLGGTIILVIAMLPDTALRKSAIEVSANGKTLKTSQDEYATLTKQAKEAGVTSKADIQEAITKSQQYKLIAAHYNIVPTEDEIWGAAVAYDNVETPAALNNWQRMNSYNLAVENLLHLEEVGGYHGTILNYPYNNLFVNNDNGGPVPAKFGDATAIAENKAYALKTATTDHEAITKDPIKVGKTVARLHLDRQLEFAGAGNDSYSFEVDKDGTAYRAGSSVTEDIRGYIYDAVKSLNGNTGVSPVLQLTSSYPQFVMAPGYPTMTDVAYYYVAVSRVVQPQPDIQKQFMQAVSNTKVQVNVK